MLELKLYNQGVDTLGEAPLGAFLGDLALCSREEFCGFVLVAELKYVDFFFFTGIRYLDAFELEQSCALTFDWVFTIPRPRLTCSYD